MANIRRWVGECLRKKKMRESHANKVIERAKAEGTELRKYFCPHCYSWHVTRMKAGVFRRE